MLRDVLLAKEAVAILMVRHDLLPSLGWSIGQRFEVDEDGNMVQDFVPVRGTRSEGKAKEVRSDLGVRVIIKYRDRKIF